MKFKKVITTFLAAAVALNMATSTAVSAQEQAISIATMGELSTLDSALYSDVPSSDMIGQVFEGLYRVAKGTEVELGQAESVEISEDGLTYTFKLREGLKWSNGDPVTAHDFEFTYRRLVDPQSGSRASSVTVFKNAAAIREGNAPVEELGVKAVDDLTLEISLEYPAPYLPKLLTGSRFLPVSKKFFEEKGEQYGTSAENIVTNGPFKMEGWNGTNLEWNLVKNEEYWDAANVQLDKALVQVVKENATGADLFDAGQLDYTVLSDQLVSQYEGGEEFHTVPKATIGYMSFNTLRETTANKHVRRAIAQAFDKDLYASSVIQDGSQPLNGQVPVNFDVDADGKDYREESGDLLTYNIEAAQADWAKAKEELGKEKIELELLTSDVGLSKRTAEFLQAQLQENLPGLTLTIKSVPLKNRLEFQRASDFDIFYGTWAPDYQDAINFIEQYETGGGINFAKYSNEEVDKLIAQARHEFANDAVKRREALKQAEKIIVQEDAVVAPMYQAATSYLLNPAVENFEVYPFGRTINLRTVTVNQ